MYGEAYPLYTYQNLQAVYAAEYWLQSFIQHNPENDFKFYTRHIKSAQKKANIN